MKRNSFTAQQLQTELGQGMTLSQIAAQQKPPVTEDQFRTRLIASLTPLLDGAVAAKQLTGAQEKAILKRLQSGPIPFWNTALHAGKTAVPAGPTTITS